MLDCDTHTHAHTHTDRDKVAASDWLSLRRCDSGFEGLRRRRGDQSLTQTLTSPWTKHDAQRHKETLTRRPLLHVKNEGPFFSVNQLWAAPVCSLSQRQLITLILKEDSWRAIRDNDIHHCSTTCWLTSCCCYLHTPVLLTSHSIFVSPLSLPHPPGEAPQSETSFLVELFSSCCCFSVFCICCVNVLCCQSVKTIWSDRHSEVI